MTNRRKLIASLPALALAAKPADQIGYKPVEIQLRQPPKRAAGTDKAAVRAYLVASFDYVSDVLAAMQEKDLIRRGGSTPPTWAFESTA